MKSCTDFMDLLGFHCDSITRRGHEVLYISTPFTLTSGKPFDFFILEDKTGYKITDDGFAMLELRQSGFELSKRTSWRSLANLAGELGFELGVDGAFFALCGTERLRETVTQALHLASGICQWEKEKSAEGDKDLSFYNEVEALLRRHREQREVVNHPVLVVDDKTFEFDFKWGEDFVDAIKPNQQSVNARLRKSIQFERLTSMSNVIYIIDDRDSYQRAVEERSVLAEVGRAILLSDLESTAA